MIRMIINTSSNPDHVGGNANIRKSPLFRLLGYRDPSLSLQVFAHANVQRRMVEAKAPRLLVPTDTYLSDKYTLYRFFNNQAVQIFHMPTRGHRRRQRRLVPPLGRDRRRRHLQQRYLSSD